MIHSIGVSLIKRLMPCRLDQNYDEIIVSVLKLVKYVVPKLIEFLSQNVNASYACNFCQVVRNVLLFYGLTGPCNDYIISLCYKNMTSFINERIQYKAFEFKI